MKEIIVAEHAGFCFGVSKAVETAYDELERARADGKKLFCLGHIIHNKIVVDELEAKGLITIKDISEAEPGQRVLIRAHGEPDSTYERAGEIGVEIIDATCPFVARIHKIAREESAKGRHLVVIGDEEHPEVRGIMGSSRLVAGAAVGSEQGYALASDYADTPLSVVAQTTITREAFETTVAGISRAHKDIKVFDTICNATRERQEAAAKLASECDAMVVIGDRESSNSKKLLQICKKACNYVKFVEKSDEISLKDLDKYNKIGVAASASAPAREIKEVITHMSELFTNQENN